jgi:hypothetical protein
VSGTASSVSRTCLPFPDGLLHCSRSEIAWLVSQWLARLVACSQASSRGCVKERNIPFTGSRSPSLVGFVRMVVG